MTENEKIGRAVAIALCTFASQQVGNSYDAIIRTVIHHLNELEDEEKGINLDDLASE